jgi:hypothetical protein
MCPGNQKPKLQDGEEQNCVIWPLCSENAGMAAGIDCYQAGVSALSQKAGGSSLAQHTTRDETNDT